MYLIPYVLVSALFWIGSMADMCYNCEQTVRSSDSVEPGSCASSTINKDKLPVGVTAKDCGNLGCYKGTVDMGTLGYRITTRNCAPPMYQENKCFEVGPNTPGINPALAKDENRKMTMCICHGDYCNGATRMDSRQAILGIFASIITILVLRY